MSTLTPNGHLWDVEQQRCIIGILVEKLGGVVEITEDDVKKSLAASGKAALYVEHPAGGKMLRLEVLPQGE